MEDELNISTLDFVKVEYEEGVQPEVEVINYGNKIQAKRKKTTSNIESNSPTKGKTSKTCFCPVCNKEFTRNEHLSRHQRTHLGFKPYQCSICPKVFGRNEHLTRHMLVHTGDKPFECEVCLKKFSRAEHLRRHKFTHLKEVHLKVECGDVMEIAGNNEIEKL